MSTIQLNSKDFASQTSSAEPVIASTVTFPPGHVVKVKSVTKTDTWTTSDNAAGGQPITGLAVTSDVPFSSSSQFLVWVEMGIVSGAGGSCSFFLNRTPAGGSTTEIGNGTDTTGTRTPCITRGVNFVSDGNHGIGPSFNFLDSPSSSVAVTYQVNLRPQVSTTYYVGRSYLYTNGTDTYNSTTRAGTITIFEVTA
jgi:hypothetical protein